MEGCKWTKWYSKTWIYGMILMLCFIGLFTVTFWLPLSAMPVIVGVVHEKSSLPVPEATLVLLHALCQCV
jgi:predicted membrane metal-binding protein